MRKVRYSEIVLQKLAELNLYLRERLMLSEEAASKRMARMEDFANSLANPADYARCRFAKWRKLGWRCAVFEKDWVFAYESFEEGVIIMDMASATSLLG